MCVRVIFFTCAYFRKLKTIMYLFSKHFAMIIIAGVYCYYNGAL